MLWKKAKQLTIRNYNYERKLLQNDKRFPIV